MNEDRLEQIQNSINKIEPSEGAKERMLANIRRKAALQMKQAQQKEQTKQEDQTQAEQTQAQAEQPEQSDRTELRLEKTAEKTRLPMEEPVPDKLPEEAAAPVKTEPLPEKKPVLSLGRVMKWVLPAAACFALIAVGWAVIPGLFKDPGEITQNGNPYVPVENAKVFQTKLGITLDAPTGATEIEYNLVDQKMADIMFLYGDHNYNLRASAQGGDFSGLYGMIVKADLIDSENNAVLATLREEEEIYRKVTWTDGKITYILSNTDGATEEDLTRMYELVK